METADDNDDDDGGDESSVQSSDETTVLQSVAHSLPSQRHMQVEPRFVAQVTECRANPVVSRRGYLLMTDSKETGDDVSAPVKRWLVSALHRSHRSIIIAVLFHSARYYDLQVH